MKKKTFLQKKYYADYYKIISLNPKNISAVVKTIDKAFGDYIKIEIDAEKWKDCDISALKRRLKDISGVIIKNIVSGMGKVIFGLIQLVLTAHQFLFILGEAQVQQLGKV